MANNAQQKRAKLVETVRNMMAKANDPRNSEHERDVAARLATKWIAKHQIEAAELRDVEGKGEKAKIVMFRMTIGNKFGMGAARADALARAVVYPMGGKILRTNPSSAKHSSIMTVFISEDIKEAVEILLTSLLLQMESGMDKAVRTFRSEAPYYWDATYTAREVKAFRISYLRTYGFTVAGRVRTGRKEAVEEARREAQAEAYANGMTDGRELANVGAEIAIVDESERAQKALEAYFAKLYGKKPKSSRSSSLVSYAGSQAGRRDGQTADIGLTRIERAEPVAV